MTTSQTHDASKVLPKKLLAELQRHCVGLIYVPGHCKKNTNTDAVLRLQDAGQPTASIARMTGMSARWVRHIVAAGRSARPPRTGPRIYRLLPEHLIRELQEYVVGRLYIPARQTKKALRDRRTERLFRKGLSVSEIASRMGLSERQVYRLRKAWSEEAARQEMGCASGSSQYKGTPVDPALESSRSIKRCRGCGRPMPGHSAGYCDLCKTIEGGVDGDVVVPTAFPFATLDSNP